MKFQHFLVAVLLSVSVSSYAQNVGINTDGSVADKSAMLDIKSTAKGMLIPRMTKKQKDSIAMPATGLLVYQTDDSTGFYFNKGTAELPNWQYISTGTAGAQGPQGVQGEKGEKGEAGAQGTQGIQGEQGPQGIMGMTGITGEIGVTGATGQKGDKGDTGEKGDPGIEGPAGIQGLQGIQGEKGDKGGAGAQGEKGDTGLQGIQGEKGNTGEKGDKGDTGAQGLKGDKGAQGMQGTQGPIGLTGATGITGMTGATGVTGASGPQGLKGDKGDAGTQGIQGTQGPQGETGPQGPAGAGFTNGSAAYQVYMTGANSPYTPSPQTVTGDVAFNKFGQTNINVNSVTNSKISDGAVTIGKISATGTANSSTFLRGDGSWTSSTSTPGVANLFTVINDNDYNSSGFQSVTNSYYYDVTESGWLLTFIPTACSAKRLSVYNGTSASITYTLRVGSSPTSLKSTALTVTVPANSLGFIDGNISIPANSFISYGYSSGTSTNYGYLTYASLSLQ